MSHLTVLNRWRRYQLARLEGLIEGMVEEAHRLPGPDLEPEVRRLGTVMMSRLAEHCDLVRDEVHKGMIEGRPVALPDVCFERL